MRQQDVHAVGPLNGSRPGEQLVHHHADRVQVAAVVHLLAADLLRADVAGRADGEIDVGVGDLAERGSPSTSLASPKSMTLMRSRGVSGSTTIRFAGFRSRWMIPSSWAAWSTSQSSPMMRPTRGALMRPFRASRRFEVDALDVLHHDARAERVVEAGIVERDGAGVLEPGHQERFALEAVAELGVGGDVFVHHLDDDIAAEVELAGEVDLAHAALAEQAAGLVPTQEYAADHAALMLRHPKTPDERWRAHQP